jgi:flagellar basal body P-ring protein FlgI
MSARKRSLSLLLLAAVLVAAGCQDLMLRLQDPKEYKRKTSKANAEAVLSGKEGHSKLLGDYISVSGYTMVQLEAVGLVAGLEGTGEDIPASPYRTALLEDMKKRRIPEPNSLLRTTDAALVLVRGYLPPLIKKGERFDLEIALPDGSRSTSLAGGWLLEADLKEHATVQGGGVREGKLMARAGGPVLIASGEGKQGGANLKHGTIPGGAIYVGQENRNLVAMVRNDVQSAKMTHRIAQRIGERFHDYDNHGLQRPLAKALTDRKIELIVHDRYRDNYNRYLQVIRNIALRETPVERHLRIQEQRESLLNPEKCEQAALALEAVGAESLPMLKEALKSPIFECRFRAAEALAYMGDSAGVDTLKEAADKEPAFRVFSLAAMSTLDDGKSFTSLIDLMNHDSLETKYGAFRALSTASPDDPNVRGEKMNGGFSLHIVDSKGPPLIHLTQRQKAELVLFGAGQEFKLPFIARAGHRIIVRGEPGGSTIHVTRIAAGEEVQSRDVSTRISDVIRACCEFNASYPDIVQLLLQAQAAHNLPGHIGIDELPRAGRVYQRPAVDGGTAEVEIGGEGLVPNIFQNEAKPSAALSAEETEYEPSQDKSSADEKPAEPKGADLDAGPDLEMRRPTELTKPD